MNDRALSDIWHEAQSEIYGGKLNFTEIGTDDFSTWLNSFPDVEKYDINSTLSIFEDWVKAPFSTELPEAYLTTDGKPCAP